MSNMTAEEKNIEFESLINKCDQYIIEHTKRKKYNQIILNVTFYVTMLCLIAITILNSIKSDASTTSLDGIAIASAILGGISVGLGAYINQRNPEKKVQEHGEIIAKLKQLIVIINYELSMNITSRTDCNKFIKSIMQLIINLNDGNDNFHISNEDINKLCVSDNNATINIDNTDEHNNDQKFELFEHKRPSENETIMYQINRLDENV
jgi:hypothetical protein